MDVPNASAPGVWLGGGARADVYRSGPYALKVFHQGAQPAQVFREAYIGALARLHVGIHRARVPLPFSQADWLAEGFPEERGTLLGWANGLMEKEGT